MLLRAEVLDGIARGDIDLAFRSWRRPTVRAGGTLRTAIGVLAIDAVDPVERDRISDTDARRAGWPDRATLLDDLDRRSADDDSRRLYRIELRPAGADPRIARREQTELDGATRAGLERALDRMDADRNAPGWARATLALLADRPGVPAAELASELGQERAAFKRRVRRLKELGLTESLRVGYRLSPRGRAYRDGAPGG